MRSLSLVLLVGLSVGSLAACHHHHETQPDAPIAIDAVEIDALVAPAFRNPLPNLSDTEVALASLKLLGAQVSDAQTNCNQCHAVSRAKLHTWKTLSNTALASCLTDLTATSQAAAQQMMACLVDTNGHFSPAKAGMYAIAAKLPWFDFMIHAANPTNGDAVYADFIGRVAMPRAGAHPALTQDEFDVVAEWLARGMPLADNLVPDENSGTCVPSITAGMTSHTTALATTGWTAKNKENNLLMFGCAGAATPRDCLATYPLASTTGYGPHWGDDLAGANLRVLRVNHYRSSYWTRSSPDGRFVAHGGGSNNNTATIIDLARDVEIAAPSYYDPGFFPDNSGFAFQGNGPELCSMSILTTGTPTSIDYASPKCTIGNTVGLYQHLGAAIGGDYWTVNGEWENDNGAYDVVNDTVPQFQSNAWITLTPMSNNGTTYVPKPAVTVQVPFEGDTVISPSSTLLVSRVTGPSTQAGYRVHALVPTPSGSSYTVDAPVIATYCAAGDKPAFSFDERYLAFHHYVTPADAIDLGFTSPNDPAFAPYLAQHASNIYLVDLATGGKTRVTHMQPGQFALFPHFRSDGWLYFLVRAPGGGDEYVVASDAALMLEAQ